MDRHKGGIYICTASNGVGHSASSQINLHVLCESYHFNLFVKIVLKELHGLNTYDWKILYDILNQFLACLWGISTAHHKYIYNLVIVYADS